jgi:hypothetical protein
LDETSLRSPIALHDRLSQAFVVHLVRDHHALWVRPPQDRRVLAQQHANYATQEEAPKYSGSQVMDLLLEQVDHEEIHTSMSVTTIVTG